MPNTTEQLARQLVEEVTARKKSRGVSPDYALLPELNALLAQSLEDLVATGRLVRRLASVNRLPAYELPPTPEADQSRNHQRQTI